MATTQAAPGKKGLINFDFLQKLGKVLMTVIAVMPAAGLMISLGKLVQMGGGDIAAVMTIGTTMENIGWAVINNLHILFAVAIGGSWAKERAGGTYTIATGVNAGSQVFGQDPLWLAWANDLINFKKAGDMAAYNNLLTTVTPARFKVGQMIGATGLLLGIALAMFRRVDADKRAKYKSMFISTALAVFLTGVTEPLEFMFMFCAMPLYIVYALLQGCAFAMAGIIHLRLHSFGNLEFITRIPMSLQAGLGGDIINFVLCVVAFFIIGYFVAYFMIGKLKLATPGRLGNYTDDNADDAAADTKAEKKADKKSDNGQAERIIALLGGRENIVLVDACMTRLRVTVKDPAKVADLAAWKAEGALSLLVKGDGIQAVYGPKADVLKSDINDIL